MPSVYKFGMDLLTTKEVASRLGVTVTRVQQMITAGRLPAEKLGRDYIIKNADLRLVENRRPGRPPKQPIRETSVIPQADAENGTSARGAKARKNSKR